MDVSGAGTAVAVFTAVTRIYANRPLITFYDDATGERTELSAATLANWTAKTANLLVDGCGLAPGQPAVLLLPPHWQTAAVLLGCWSAGLAVDLPDLGTRSGRGPDRPDRGFRAAVAFATADRVGQADADEVFALALAPMAAPLPVGQAPGVRDYVVQVRGHGDHFAPPIPVRPQTRALVDGRTHADLVAAAADRAGTAGLRPGGRVLLDGDAHADPIDWLLAPFVAGCSLVLCRHLDPARVPDRLAAERATHYQPRP